MDSESLTLLKTISLGRVQQDANRSGLTCPRELHGPPLSYDLRFGPFWNMATWFDDIAIIAARRGVSTSGSAFVGAEEVLIHSGQTVQVVLAEP